LASDGANTGIFSLSVVGAFVACDFVVPNGLVGPLAPRVIYVPLYVNLDWWESFWVAWRRSILVFSYVGADSWLAC